MTQREQSVGDTSSTYSVLSRDDPAAHDAMFEDIIHNVVDAMKDDSFHVQSHSSANTHGTSGAASMLIGQSVGGAQCLFDEIHQGVFILRTPLSMHIH